MKFLCNYFYWASEGSVEATPAAIVCVDVSDTVDHTTSPNDVGVSLRTAGVFDDIGWRLGFTQDDVDLIRKDKGDNTFAYLTSEFIVADFMATAIENSFSGKWLNIGYDELVEALAQTYG